MATISSIGIGSGLDIEGVISQLMFSPDGRILAASSDKEGVTLWSRE